MLEDVILLYIYDYKWTSYDIWFLKYKVWYTNFFVILGHFLPFKPPDNQENQNFKIGKKTHRHYNFALLHQWQLYDVWFLRYGAQQRGFFLILDRFLPFYPPMNPKYQNFTEIIPEIWHVTDIIAIFHFGLFFAIFPP